MGKTAEIKNKDAATYTQKTSSLPWPLRCLWGNLSRSSQRKLLSKSRTGWARRTRRESKESIASFLKQICSLPWTPKHSASGTETALQRSVTSITHRNQVVNLLSSSRTKNESRCRFIFLSRSNTQSNKLLKNLKWWPYNKRRTPGSRTSSLPRSFRKKWRKRRCSNREPK